MTKDTPIKDKIQSILKGKDVKTIEIKDLKQPKSIAIKKVPEEEFFIDFNKIANNSSFQRFILETIKTCVPHLKSVSVRTSKDIMSKAFSNKINEISTAMNVVKRMDPEVLSELKEVLAKREARIEDQE